VLRYFRELYQFVEPVWNHGTRLKVDSIYPRRKDTYFWIFRMKRFTYPKNNTCGKEF
jgi:hypothetical protein